MGPSIFFLVDNLCVHVLQLSTNRTKTSTYKLRAYLMITRPFQCYVCSLKCKAKSFVKHTKQIDRNLFSPFQAFLHRIRQTADDQQCLSPEHVKVGLTFLKTTWIWIFFPTELMYPALPFCPSSGSICWPLPSSLFCFSFISPFLSILSV